MNGWSRRPVALHSVAYPHQCEQPAVNFGRRGTHRAAHKGAQALRAVVDVVVHVYGLPVHLRLIVFLFWFYDFLFLMCEFELSNFLTF